MQHADPTGLRHSLRVGMMHQCSTAELLGGAALVHHDDKCHLLATSILKGLKYIPYVVAGFTVGVEMVQVDPQKPRIPGCRHTGSTNTCIYVHGPGTCIDIWYTQGIKRVTLLYTTVPLEDLKLLIKHSGKDPG